MKHYFITNPAAGKKNSCDILSENIEKACNEKGVSFEIYKTTGVGDATEFVRKTCKANTEGEELRFYACGGDGTLNHYINGLRGVDYPNQVLYYPGGSGNDFYHCVCQNEEPHLVEVTHLVKNLPTAIIKGKEYSFINGVGYGIDGYCCEVADKQREKGKTEINYTAIAILGVLFFYKPTGVTVTVDGVEHRFENAWLAPMMNGRYFGGGMMPTPEQVRNSGELSVMVFHKAGKLRLLTIFPSLFKGEHVKHTKYVSVFKGKEITVKYDEPRPLQVDGETIVDVPECTVKAYGVE